MMTPEKLKARREARDQKKTDAQRQFEKIREDHLRRLQSCYQPQETVPPGYWESVFGVKF